MATDIHLAVQRRKRDRQALGETWERVEAYVPDKRNDGPEPRFRREELYRARNYVLFAALAGVRNGFGFAECVTHEPLAPIAEGRGLPPDFAAEMTDGAHHGTRMGEHSFTWMTLAEIVAYDWERKILHSGWVSAPVRAAQMQTGLRRPSEWCGGVDGPGIRHMSVAALDAEIKAGKIDDRAYAELTWEEALRYTCEDFLNLLPAFRALAPPEDVRLVMGFDS